MAKPDFAKGKGNGKANGKAKGNANRKPDSTIGKPDLTIEFDSVRAPELFPDEKGQVKLDASNVGEERYKGALEISLYARRTRISIYLHRRTQNSAIPVAMSY
jgi:hypothetical protein